MGSCAIASGSPAPQRTDLRRVGPVVALVVAAHALLLAIPRHVAASGASATASVQLRIVEVLPPQQAAPPVTTAAEGNMRASVQQPTNKVPAQSVERRNKATETVPPVAMQAVPQAPAWLDIALPGVATDDDLYFARSLLSVVPAPIDPVLIDYPEFKGDAGRYVAELSLFIDESGSVIRVRVDSGALPPALEDAARKAFVQARFRPGEVADHGAVKSRIRVEVVFEGGAPLLIG